MTIAHPIEMQIAQDVFPEWDALGVTERAQKLALALPALSIEQGKMAQWQLENAKQNIAEKQIMPGPTGERNELSTKGRGPFLVTLVIPEDDITAVGFVGQVFTALVAGNPVITVGSLGQKITDAITPFVPHGVVQSMAKSAQKALLESEQLAGIATLCDNQHAIERQQLLANKSGLICQLIAETDNKNLSRITKPHYLLNFVTEQTMSNNTTAIGGNATLLELGSMED